MPRRTAIPRLFAAVMLLGAAALSGCGYVDFDTTPGSDSLLTAFSPPSPGEAARLAINPYNADDRYRGTLLLANSIFGGEPLYLELFEQAARDPEANVRAAGIRGLANHGRPRHVPILVDRLENDEPRVRLAAARGLQRLHNPVAILPLIERIDIAFEASDDSIILTEPESEVRAACAHALGQYAEPRVIPALIGALNDPDLVVNTYAAESLSTLTGQAFELDRRAWAAWYRDAGSDLFAGRVAYSFPAFNRERFFIEYLPFLPQPPNEASTRPIGMPPLGREGSVSFDD